MVGTPFGTVKECQDISAVGLTGKELAAQRELDAGGDFSRGIVDC